MTLALQLILKVVYKGPRIWTENVIQLAKHLLSMTKSGVQSPPLRKLICL